MASQFQTQKATTTTTPISAQPSFQSRAFAVQAKTDSGEELQEPNLQSQITAVERLGHSFDRVQVQSSATPTSIQTKLEMPIQREEEEEGQMKAEGTEASLQIPSIQREEEEEGQMKAEGTEASLQMSSIQRQEDEPEEG